MAGRFPGAGDVDALWALVAAGRHGIRILTEGELEAAGVPSSTLANPLYVRAGASIDGPDLFDAEYFGYSPREAEIIDPQQRIFLECAVHALESASIDPARFSGRIGVFAGSAPSPYLLHGGRPLTESAFSPANMAFGSANDKDYVATRASYKLDLRGPAVTVQTACSTSLVAVHMACQSLIAGECDLAIAGGVSIVQGTRPAGYVYTPGGVLSADGLCRPFDAAASGTIFGDGVGIVVLRRLEDAQAAGDPIRVLVRGSAINNDGAGKLAFAAPSASGQARVIEDALDAAKLKPCSLAFIEAHGTGTQIGDRIEIEALRRVWSKHASARSRCLVGSIKSNIGHLNTAAGIAGLIKATMVMQHGIVPPMANFEHPHPSLRIEETPFEINTEVRSLDCSAGPVFAAVSSFGIGGTNAHIVLERYRGPAELCPVPGVSPGRLFLVSARTRTALARTAAELASRVRSTDPQESQRLARTLATARTFYPLRQFLVLDEAANVYQSPVVVAPAVPRKSKSRKEHSTGVAFLIPGQGAQVARLAKELLTSLPVFREEFTACIDAALSGTADPSLKSLDAECSPSPEAQAAQFAAFCYAIGRQLQAWGVKPEAIFGVSIGELIGASLAGALPRDAMMAIVTKRAKLMAACPSGAMLAVPMGADALPGREGVDLDLAVSSGPQACVLSGSKASIAAYKRRLEADGIEALLLDIPYASHSRLMQPAEKACAKLFDGLEFATLAVPLLSGTRSDWHTDATVRTPGYWAEHLRRTIRLDACLSRIAADIRPKIFLQLGPGTGFTRLVREIVPDSSCNIIEIFRNDGSEGAAMLDAAGRLWQKDVVLDWEAICGGKASDTRADLPKYPFDHQSYWLPANGVPAGLPHNATGETPRMYVPTWQRLCDALFRTPLDAAGGPILVVRGKDPVSRLVVTRLRTMGFRLGQALVGPAFAVLADDTFQIDPRRPTDYAALLEALRERGIFPTAVIHSLLLDETANTDTEAIDRGFCSLLHLAQALDHAAADVGHSVRILVLTAGAHKVIGNESGAPAAATTHSACLSIRQESKALNCQVLDLPSSGPDEDAPGACADAAIRAVAGSMDYELVAFRGRHFWCRQMTTVEPPAASTTRLKAGGTYLLTGGLGGVGFEVAKHLAQHYRANLVLVGRSAIPAHPTGNGGCNGRDPNDRTPNRIKQIDELEAAGVTVSYHSADVADVQALRAVVVKAEQRHGRIDGVFHLAAQDAIAPLARWSRDAALATMRPKVHGARSILSVFSSRPPDFIVFFSSLSSLLGAPGKVDYAAGNGFLDACATHIESPPAPIISIAWDIWSNLGIAAGKDADEVALSSAEALPFLAASIDVGAAQVAVSKRELAHELRRWRSTRIHVVDPPLRQALRQRPELLGEYVAPRTDAEQVIAGLWAESLGIDQVGREDDFFDLGGDSLLVIRLLPKLGGLFRVQLTARDFYQARTLSKLAALVETVILDEAAAALPLEARR
jgi:acyl transferase domain-containing protein/acyl carrier protein